MVKITLLYIAIILTVPKTIEQPSYKLFYAGHDVLRLLARVVDARAKGLSPAEPAPELGCGEEGNRIAGDGDGMNVFHRLQLERGEHAEAL